MDKEIDTNTYIENVNTLHLSDSNARKHAICNDNSNPFSLKKKRLRFRCIADAYSNISSAALKTIMKNYVQQRVECLSIGLSRENTAVGINSVKNLIKCLKTKSVLLIGKAGYGKSTALRWLFLHMPGRCVYVRMCNLNIFAPDEIMAMLESALDSKQIVFLDGIDESIACLNDIRFIKNLTDWLLNKNIRFIISTRVDHFDGITSLLERYFSKRTITHRDGLAVFEIKGFTLPQFIKSSMILKRLCKKDKLHFGKKFPAVKRTKEVKKELARAFSENVLFQTPLFSRYAFVLLDAAKGGLTLSTAIQKIIRWECHDYLISGNVEELKSAFNFYENQIQKYLESVAFSIGASDNLESSTYECLREKYIVKPLKNFISQRAISDDKLHKECMDMIVNASLCLLNKPEDGKSISFEHPIFKEFFIAKRLANENLLEDEKYRKFFYSLSESKSFIDTYVTQLVANGKISILQQRIRPRRSYVDANTHLQAFVEDIYTFLTDIEGVELLLGTTLTPLAELFPNIRVNCSKGNTISPIWLEIYNLRQAGLLVSPTFAVSNAQNIALTFCEDYAFTVSIPKVDFDLIKAAYKLHTEFFTESDVNATNYIALIYARMLQKIYYRDTDGESYTLMNQLAKHYDTFACETSRYFCLWFSKLIAVRYEYEVSSSWAKHALRKIDGVRMVRSLQVFACKQIMKNSICSSDWVEFDVYYNTCCALGEILDFSIMRYRIERFIVIKEYKAAHKMLLDYENDTFEDYVFLYLKATCMNRLQTWEGFSELVSKLESLAEKEKDKWHKCRLNCIRMDLLISYYNLIEDRDQLLQTAKNAIVFYTEWKSSIISDIQNIIDALEDGSYAFDILVEPGLWI